MVGELGIVRSSPRRKYIQVVRICPKCDELIEISLPLPDRLRDTPEGFLVYLDLNGTLQVIDEDPHDYSSGDLSDPPDIIRMDSEGTVRRGSMADSHIPTCLGSWEACDKIEGCLYITSCIRAEEVPHA